MEISLTSLQDLDEFTVKLAPHLAIGDVVALKGDLGAGKTTLAKHLINKLTDKYTEVTSPTFNIVQIYNTPTLSIWHFDLYRLQHQNELTEIGLSEALDSSISLIEWPEIATELLPQEKLTINLSCGKNNERMLRLEGEGKWADIIRITQWKKEKN